MRQQIIITTALTVALSAACTSDEDKTERPKGNHDGRVSVDVTSPPPASGDGGQPVIDPEQRFTPSSYLLLTAARLAIVQESDAVDTPAWQRLIENVDAEMAQVGGRSSTENIALAYLVTGEAIYAATAYDWARDIMDTADVAFDRYLHYGDHMRAVAFAYNYCYDTLSGMQRTEMRDYMVRWTDEVWSLHGADAVDNNSNWGISQPANNYHYAFLEGLAFVGYALLGSGAPIASDYLVLLTTKIEGSGGVLEYLSAGARGGDWHEGVNYGQRSKQRMASTFSVIAAAGGPNYFAASPFFAEAIYAAIYQALPGRVAIQPAGDLARTSAMPLGPYDRDYVQAATFWIADDIARGYGQYYLNHYASSYNMGGFNGRGLYYRDVMYGLDLTEHDVSDLPLYYHSIGNHWINLRSSWDEDATCINISATPDMYQGHSHQDSGSFTIFKHDWLAVDSATYSRSGTTWESGAHNMVGVAGQERRGGDNVPGLQAFEYHSESTYVQVDASNLMKHRPGSDELMLLDEYTREMVYFPSDDVLVTYDRVAPGPDGSDYSWRLHFAEEPSQSGNRFSLDFGGGGISLVQLSGGAASIASDSDLEPSGSESFRVQEAPGNGGRFLNVMAVASGTAPSPDVSSVTSTSAIEGAVIDTRVAIFSSSTKGGAISLPLSYTFTGTGTFRHIIANLSPGSALSAEVSASGGETTVTISSGGALMATSNGVLRFNQD